jgi:hypothetical protein
MSTTTWTVRNQTQSVDYAGVQSLNFSTGRVRFIDSYNGNTMSVTILNNNESTFVGNLGDQLRVFPTVNAYYGNAMVFWITSFIYNDEPGSMGNSTITILAEDNIARLGRIRVDGVVTTAGDYALYQARSMINTYGAPVTAAFTPGARSVASGQTYTGSVADFMRTALQTEQGYLTCNTNVGSPTASGGSITMYGRGSSALSQKYVFGRTASTTVIGYQDFQRNKFYDIYANRVTVNPLGLASQTETNAAAVTTYGTYAVDLNSIDATTGLADNLASYLVSVMSDLNLLNITISFTDKAQTNGGAYPTTDIYRDFASELGTLQNYQSTIYYRQPGDSSDRSINVILTGYSVSATPSGTTWTCNFAPFTIYAFFFLNSTTQGILDQSRLNWGS